MKDLKPLPEKVYLVVRDGLARNVMFASWSRTVCREWVKSQVAPCRVVGPYSATHTKGSAL